MMFATRAFSLKYWVSTIPYFLSFSGAKTGGIIELRRKAFCGMMGKKIEETRFPEGPRGKEPHGQLRSLTLVLS